MLDPRSSAHFSTSFGDFAARTALLGALKALSQLALKTLLPGVPDFYQGTELWDFSLVDPDNRRPVDFARCGKLKRSWRTAAGSGATTGATAGIKLAFTRRLLHLRREFPGVFAAGLTSR